MMNSIRRALVLAALLLPLAEVAHAQFVYWLDTNYGAPALRRASVYGTDRAEIPLAPGSLPEGLAFSPGQGKLIYGESSFAGAAIRQTTPTLVAPFALVPGQSCARGVAAHPVTGQVWWTTSNLVTGSQLWRCDADGGNAQALVTLGGATNLRGVAVDAAGGKLYLADFGQDLILRANLDGTALEVFQFLGPGAGPWGVLFDAGAQRVYWCEYTAGRVRHTLASGGVVIETLYGGLGNPTWLERLPDPDAPGGFYLLWAEARAGAQRVVLAVATGGGVYPTTLQVAAYGGIAYVPGDALAVDLSRFATPEFSLARPGPNPATAATVVEFALPSESSVRLFLVDVQGRLVASLVDGVLPAGRHTAGFAALWAAHRPAAGVYFLRFEAAGRQLTRKVVVAD